MEDDREPRVTDLSLLFGGRDSLAAGAGPLVVLRGRWGHASTGDERRRRGRRLLREAESSLWGETADPVVTARCPRCGGDHGRPVVIDRASGLRLPGSVSHAGATTLVAASPAAVGIDAEPLEGHPSRFAAIREVSGRPDVADGVEALLLWTTIEAVLKADGRGLDIDPRRVSVEGDARTSGSSAWVDTGSRFLLRGSLIDGLVVTVAVSAP